MDLQLYKNVRISQDLFQILILMLPRKELFWDYTFPIHSPNQINQELPSDIDNNLKLLHIYSGTSGIGTSHNKYFTTMGRCAI